MIYMTKYGVVYHSSVCKSDWRNIVEAKRYRKPNGQLIDRPVALKLQKSALKSLRTVEERLNRQVVVTGTWRSCAFQAECYRKDPQRFAPPNSGVHTHGLAIDVNMNWLNSLKPDERNHFHRAMLYHGWNQSRPSDEPWHWSYKLTA